MLTKLLTSPSVYYQNVTRHKSEPYTWERVRTCMKPISTLLSFVFVALLLALIHSCSEAPETRTAPLSCKPITAETLALEVEVSYAPDSIPVRLPKNGVLESFSVPTGRPVTENRVLAILENRDVYAALRDQKLALQNQLRTLEFPAPLESVSGKWKRFGETIALDDLLPQVPEFRYKEELDLLQENGIIEAINAIVRNEKSLRPYFISAPASGIFRSAATPGRSFKKGDVLGYIHKTKQVQINLSDDIRAVQTPLILRHASGARIRFVNNTGAFEASGFSPALTGTTTLQANSRVFKIPRDAIQGGQIRTVRNGKMQTRPVRVLLETDTWSYVRATTQSLCLVC